MVTTNDQILKQMLGHVGVHAVHIHKSFEKCAKCNSEPATVENFQKVIAICDNCCARMIVASKTPEREERSWVDIKDADRIRLTDEFVKAMEANGEEASLH